MRDSRVGILRRGDKHYPTAGGTCIGGPCALTATSVILRDERTPQPIEVWLCNIAMGTPIEWELLANLIHELHPAFDNVRLPRDGSRLT